MSATVITFPADRITPPGEACEARVIPFPVYVPPHPVWSGIDSSSPERQQITELVNRLADATDRHPMEVNIELLIAGFPRRAACTSADLRGIRDYLLSTMPVVACA